MLVLLNTSCTRGKSPKVTWGFCADQAHDQAGKRR